MAVICACGHIALSRDERAVFKRLESLNTITANDIKGLFKTTISGASNILTRMHKQSLLRRQKVLDPTGGYYYVYSMAPGQKSCQLSKPVNNGARGPSKGPA